jgi:YesN/AraC family two-component response regulator
MYKVIVVDDEPTSLEHVCMILEKKHPDCNIIGKAIHGEKALELMELDEPDILFTDVRMPVMDGITLVKKVKEKYPEVLSVIVSGYSEFEYAKSAMSVGVCDYLLKPLTPTDVDKLMKRLKKQLEGLFYQKRNELLKRMCGGEQLGEELLSRYFPKGQYYSAIIRKNGLPKRFSVMSSVELLPMAEERIYFYGRDELEALYLFSETFFGKEDVETIIKTVSENARDEYSYMTMIIYPDSFTLDGFTRVAKKLYKGLDRGIVIGENQYFTEGKNLPESQKNAVERELVEKVEYMIRYKEYGKLQEGLQELFQLWGKLKCGQLHVESWVKHFFALIRNFWNLDQNMIETEYAIDDAFYYATSMEELKKNIMVIMEMCSPQSESELYDDKRQLLQSVMSYLNRNLAKPMTINEICREFGISQTVLSKMFRTYENTSFSNYLTGIRIKKAQEYMKKDPGAYVKDMAERVGYQDQFYFSRIFRSITGKSPSEYMDIMSEKGGNYVKN